ncbi:hypothetical protein CPB84DRAFT_1786362 [Gymnopilus junonius]|uniref:DUF6697 domain-containing protein n=1 Tax=Gymnopilus junonius TaxID=109634 RepID=A0A9P5NFS7_GYMJU|nr:hypothetical protein CPB84DRAFT_1786362 [Gymnopilus junonius]
MLELPGVDHRPRTNALSPIHHTDVNLKKYLAADKRTSKCSTNFLYLPGLLRWCPKKVHAIAMGPIHVFDSDKGHWVKKSIFETLYGKTFSLFYKNGFETYYVGTYQAVKLLDMFPDGFHDSKIFNDGLSMSALADATFSSERKIKNGAGQPPSSSNIRQLYLDGILKIEPLGLQCVGFDQNLYMALKVRYETCRPAGLSGMMHYPENTQQGRPKKKQKTE